MSHQRVVPTVIVTIFAAPRFSISLYWQQATRSDSMRKHLTRFLPLSRSNGDIHSTDSKPCSAFSRVQDHVEELRRYFELPADELFLDEFYCALSKRILLQGRMYIFEHHLCFYSNVFGWVKRKVIPLHQVKEITKKRNYGFPNSIEVLWKKREFFTSFLNRTDAYELLCDAVKHVEVPSPTSSDGTSRSSRRGHIGDGVHTGRQRESPQGSSSSSLGSRRSDGRSPKRAIKSVVSDPGDDSDLDGDDEETDVWSVITGAAPAVPENMVLLYEDRYEVCVQEFFTRTLSTDSMFLDGYHKRRGDTRYRITGWEQLSEISGFVRQATFVSPVKGVRGIGFMSPKNTECNQDHRLCIYRGDHLVFQISQVMKDIPYGDNFSVELRWDVTPIPDSTSCQISIHVAVPFIRSVLAPFRSMIETNVMKEMQDSVKMMSEMLKDTLHPTLPDELTESGIDPQEQDESVEPSTHALSKLQNLLNNEEGLQRLEHLVESTELLERNVSKTELKTPPMHSASVPPPLLPSSINWVLFFACLFMLFCQVMLIVAWMVTHPRASVAATVEGMGHYLEQSFRQLYEMETAIVATLQLLNRTVADIT